jgi:small subunit ribosomal protein S1
MKDFEQYLQASMDNLNLTFTPGQKINGTVVAIDKRTVFIDVNSTSEGVINKEELLDKNGKLKVKIGDSVEAYFVDSGDEGIMLTVKMSGDMSREHLDEAYSNKIPVVGKVIAERKGGYSVKIAGLEAFCPYSQIDLFRNDNAKYTGNSYPFIITELNSRNIVVSRRLAMQEELDRRWENIDQEFQCGDICDGRVLKIMKFGVFVDLGGIEGFIPISELTWSRTSNIEEIFKENDSVKVMIKEVNKTDRKMTLSYRSATIPWHEIEQKYTQGKFCEAKVSRLENFGAFVELEPGIEGLIHISKVGRGKRIKHPREVISEGEMITVKIEAIDSEKFRISLTPADSADSAETYENSNTKPTEIIDASADNSKTLEQGMTIKGIIDGIKPYGLFVKLNTKETGLLHISQLKPADKSGKYSNYDVSKHFNSGDSINVIIDSIADNGKISLTTPERQKEEQDRKSAPTEFTDKSGGSFGSMENVFSGLKL